MRFNGHEWMRFGPEDGLIDNPKTIIASRDGIIWAAGSHLGKSADAQFNGTYWSLRTFPHFAETIDFRAVFQSADNAL